jgi:hypothetical protein
VTTRYNCRSVLAEASRAIWSRSTNPCTPARPRSCPLAGRLRMRNSCLIGRVENDDRDLAGGTPLVRNEQRVPSTKAPPHAPPTRPTTTSRRRATTANAGSRTRLVEPTGRVVLAMANPHRLPARDALCHERGPHISSGATVPERASPKCRRPVPERGTETSLRHVGFEGEWSIDSVRRTATGSQTSWARALASRPYR